ncbi:hypothetical protein [Candidatus Methanodesulfokora washburnensis]|uniref:Uncharacterized protein n=1 Tax=Candidatus Methanodesulfokora washburnensis TaxID=2478471 RepID=A0A3R9PES9_9CREN|nr:hypothetical protein [Candidatus Methanodesulfokores washburnensis]RSN72461.1 hypothetical protein D6D85_13705 [Candidatus Methanodesulfokores washburnensis]
MEPVVLRGRRELEVWKAAYKLQTFRYSDLQKELRNMGCRDQDLVPILRSLMEKGLLMKKDNYWIVTARNMDIVAVNIRTRRMINLITFLISFFLLLIDQIVASVCVAVIALLYTISDEFMVIALPEHVVYVEKSISLNTNNERKEYEQET